MKDDYNMLNGKPIGTVVGSLDCVQLRDIILHSGDIAQELKETLLFWLEYTARHQTDFTVIATYPEGGT
jgi:hypothetical protein